MNKFNSDGSFVAQMVAMQKGSSRSEHSSKLATRTVSALPATGLKRSAESVKQEDAGPTSKKKTTGVKGIKIQLGKKTSLQSRVHVGKSAVFGDDDDDSDDDSRDHERREKLKADLPPPTYGKLPPVAPPSPERADIKEIITPVPKSAASISGFGTPAFPPVPQCNNTMNRPFNYASCPPPQDPLSKLKHYAVGKTGSFVPSATSTTPVSRKPIFSDGQRHPFPPRPPFNASSTPTTAYPPILPITPRFGTPSVSPSNTPVDKSKRKSRWGDTGSSTPVPPTVPPPTLLRQVPPVGGSAVPVPAQNIAYGPSGAAAVPPTTQPSVPAAALLMESDPELKAIKARLIAKEAVKRIEAQAKAEGKLVKHDYDSDEDTDGGTWEHKRRAMEMEATKIAPIVKPVERGSGHHIGDFLPPDVAVQFLPPKNRLQSTTDAVKPPPGPEEYAESKLTESNLGFKMLQKMGWKEGQGLGQADGAIVNPISAGKQAVNNSGVGANSLAPCEDDDEFELYRKRMMLAYQYRPNPLNNPRRKYY